MQDYIRYQEAERLLSLYPDMKVLTENIRRQIKGISEGGDNRDDDIAGLALRHALLNDMPVCPTNTISDKTCRTAIEYKKVIDSEKAEALQELLTELTLLENVIDKINIGMTVLSEVQRDIIQARYWEGLTWSEIAGKLIMAESSCKQRRKEALERLCKVVRIAMDEYEAVLRLFS